MKRFGDLFKFQRTAVNVNPTESYIQIGVKSFGKGIFEYPQVDGSMLGKLRYFKFPPNALVVSNIQAWEGALGVTSWEESSRCVASNRFYPAVPVDETSTCVDFALRYLLSEPGMRHVRAASPGTTARNKTVSLAAFENILIPQPPFEEQKQVASWVSAVESRSEVLYMEVSARADRSAYLVRAAVDGASRGLTSSRTVRELVSVVTDVVHPGQDPFPAQAFVGLEHIAQNLGQRLGSEAVGGEKGRKLRFRPSDVLYGYLRPYQNKVWLSDLDGLCSVEQYVLRAREPEDAELVSHLLRGASVYDRVVAATNNLQLPRLRIDTLLSLEVAWPKNTHERDDALSGLYQANAAAARIYDLHQAQVTAVKAMLPAALNEVFGSLN